MKRFLVILTLTIGIVSHLVAGWDQSLSRWESECSIGMAARCSIAGSMYENGRNVTFDGMYNHESDMKKDFSRALKFYKKGCGLGDKLSCERYNKLSKKLGGKTTPEKHNKLKKNYKVYYKEGDTIYKIIAKNPCYITFGKNARIIKNSCKKLTNSKGIKIYCIQSKTVCKTESEIRQAIR